MCNYREIDIVVIFTDNIVCIELFHYFFYILLALVCLNFSHLSYWYLIWFIVLNLIDKGLKFRNELWQFIILSENLKYINISFITYTNLEDNKPTMFMLFNEFIRHCTRILDNEWTMFTLFELIHSSSQMNLRGSE